MYEIQVSEPLNKLLKAIGRYMGYNWFGRAMDTYRGHLTFFSDQEPKRGLFVMSKANEYRPGARLHISGIYPVSPAGNQLHGWYDDPPDKLITVSSSRGPEAIARDITRRLLPSYQKMYDIALQRYKEAVEYAQELSGVAEELSYIFNTFDQRGGNSDVRIYFGSVLASDPIRGKVEYSRVNQVKLTLENLSVEEARAVAEVLKIRERLNSPIKGKA